jgi:uncharacterized protein (DUF2235 family)
MRRLVICFDGTWNQVRKPTQVTNVVKFAQAVKPVDSRGASQIVYYNSGVGTGDVVDRFLGGVFGRGIKATVKRALAFLALNFQRGDEIYVTGFSRGAYSARALAGVIGSAGVPRQADFEHIETIWNYYRSKTKEEKEKIKAMVVQTPIRCVAVWDTVGSYGVPAGFGLGGFVRAIAAWTRGFHDNHPGGCIELGLHALAIDEKRRPFAPTLWTWPKPETKKDWKASTSYIEQVWFAGAHANVGGGYPNCGLSDMALIWMMARIEALGRDKFGSVLEFNTDAMSANLQPCVDGKLYPSARGWPISSVWPYHRPVLLPDKALNANVFWNSENAADVHLGERVHWSATRRHGAKLDPGYRPRNVTFPPSTVTEITPEEQKILDAIGRSRMAAGQPALVV